MLDQDSIRQIVDALEQLDWVVGVKSLLAAQVPPGEGGGGMGGEEPSAAGVQLASPPAGPQAPPRPQPAAPRPAGTRVSEGRHRASEMDEEYRRQYGADEADDSYRDLRTVQPSKTPPRTGVVDDDYSWHRTVAERAMYSQPASKVSALKRRRANSQHYSRAEHDPAIVANDAQYREARRGVADRVARYALKHGLGYDDAMRQLGVEPPAPLAAS